MSYYNWLYRYFKEKQAKQTIDETLDDLFHLLDCRAQDYLELNKERYNELYLNPDTMVLDDIAQKKLQIVQQIKPELRDFLKLLIEHKATRVLQIGLGHWGSTHFMLSFITELLVTVEYDRNNINRYVTGEKTYNALKEKIIHGDSANSFTVTQAGLYAPYDAVFIDGNHSYEYVEMDYANYSPLVKPGGIIAFHDALVTGDQFGTPQVLSQLKPKHKIKYIVHSKNVGIAYFIK